MDGKRAGWPGIDPRRTAAWRWSGACRGSDPELFFPEGSGRHAAQQERAAKQVCGRCPVRAVCLAWALTRPEAEGIWGGTSPFERRLLRAAAIG
ncbi:MAG TPA: WhiB family transcriptional regulator [Streptosporangiaceae bacterium]